MGFPASWVVYDQECGLVPVWNFLSGSILSGGGISPRGYVVNWWNVFVVRCKCQQFSGVALSDISSLRRAYLIIIATALGNVFTCDNVAWFLPTVEYHEVWEDHEVWQDHKVWEDHKVWQVEECDVIVICVVELVHATALRDYYYAVRGVSCSFDTREHWETSFCVSFFCFDVLTSFYLPF